MATLEKVMQMKQQGLSEPQIIDMLKKDGISPKEIYESLSQSQIKSALNTQQAAANEFTNMRPSIMIQEGNQAIPNPEEYSEETIPDPESSYESYPQPETQEGYYQEGYNQGYYPEYQPPSQTTDIETINEITEQIVEEKNAELKKQISSFKNFRDETKIELEKINERLQKLESNFNEMQMAVLRKVGEYGENIKNISDEMHYTQDSFSKILNPLTDNIRELQKITGNIDKPLVNSITSHGSSENLSESSQESRKKSEKQKSDFEDYLR